MNDDSLVEPAPLMERRSPKAENTYKRSVFSVPVCVQVCIGNTSPSVQEILELKQGSLLKLSSKIEDPVELRIGDIVIARGELIEVEDEPGRLGVKLTEVVDVSEEVLP